MRELFILHKKQLRDLLRYGTLRTEVLQNPGLYNGKLGMAIIFYEYSRYKNDILYEQFADEIIDSILELSNSLPLNFSNGLAGIGWGIVYLLKENFIEGNINDILVDIDNKFTEVNIQEKEIIEDYLSYTNFREYYVPHNKSNNIQELNKNQKKVLKQIWESCFLTLSLS